eukprot:30110-Hanusia_phi.AAC.2
MAFMVASEAMKSVRKSPRHQGRVVAREAAEGSGGVNEPARRRHVQVGVSIELDELGGELLEVLDDLGCRQKLADRRMLPVQAG